LSQDLDPNTRYCFVTLAEMRDLFSEHTVLATELITSQRIRDTLLSGAEIICVSARPPAYVQEMIRRRNVPLHSRIERTQRLLDKDAEYQRAKQAITRFRKSENDLPTTPTYRCQVLTETEAMRSLPQVRRFKQLEKRQKQLARVVQVLEQRYSVHLALDQQRKQTYRPATFPDRWAVFYTRYPLALLLASGHLDTRALESDSYSPSEHRGVVSSALIYLLQQEANQ